MTENREISRMKHVLALIYVKVHQDNLQRLPGEEGNPIHSPDVSSTPLRGGLDTTLQVTSK
jgi:hypothetical protein